LKLQKRINRPRFHSESGWVKSFSVPMTYVCITFGSAYSDTAAATSCSRQSHCVKSWVVTNWIKFSLSLVPAILHLQHSLGKRFEQRG